MKKICLVALSFVTIISADAQTIKAKLDAAIRQLEKDPQLKHGLIGFSVIDAATGKTVYERNAEIGLTPASTQKIFTSIAAFELLGKDFRYKTVFGYDGKAQKDSITRSPLYIMPSGDPTLGSWRFRPTKPNIIIETILHSFRNKGLKTWMGGILVIQSKFESQAIPNGWIWEDIGNYYGAGHYDLNWNENQYDLVLKPGYKPGDSVKLVTLRPDIKAQFINELKAASKTSGDNAYIYFDPLSQVRYVRGTVPCCIDSFTISGASDGPSLLFGELHDYLRSNKFIEDRMSFHIWKGSNVSDFTPLYDHYSPTLDSINYYFLKRSINLYGEALIRTISLERAGIGSTTRGIEFVKELFEKIGIDKYSMGIIDGSGLSPQNRVSTNSLTKALQYAKTRPWFSSFYYALPEINGMKMKSGSIGGVRSYAGYQKAANGKEYIFSIIVNNYIGSSSEVNKKLFKILDLLK